MIRVGPAGWSYPDWAGKVYPRLKPRGFHPLAFLSEFVNTIEVNSSFYAQPRAELTRRWAELVKAHEHFIFAVKLLRDFTHAHEPEDESAWQAAAAEFQAGIEPLRRAGRLGPLLVQFPVTFLHGAAEVRRLGSIRSLFPDADLVLEVRHQSWFEPPALDTLRGLGYSLAHIDLPSAWNHPPDRHRPTGCTGYLRLHGRNEREWFRSGAGRDDRYDYLYSTEELRGLVRKAASIALESENTYVVTNNHFAGKAVANAIEILYLGNRTDAELPAAPADLVRSYPHLGSITRISGQRDLFA